MLVITRKESQTIHLIIAGQTAVVHILQVKNLRCSVGIKASPDFRIMRGEVLEADQAAESERAEE